MEQVYIDLIMYLIRKEMSFKLDSSSLSSKIEFRYAHEKQFATNEMLRLFNAQGNHSVKLSTMFEFDNPTILFVFKTGYVIDGRIKS